jgi:endonuclease/exonuclease/phosphatase family metal-dependent hydrolase
VGEEARKNSALLLVRKITEIAGDEPVVLTGDFNCDKASEPYGVLTEAREGLRLFDTHFLSRTEHTGGLQSMNRFRDGLPDSIIDFVFCGPAFRVTAHAILPIRKDGVFVSDHYPVFATLGYEK